MTVVSIGLPVKLCDACDNEDWFGRRSESRMQITVSEEHSSRIFEEQMELNSEGLTKLFVNIRLEHLHWSHHYNFQWQWCWLRACNAGQMHQTSKQQVSVVREMFSCKCVNRIATTLDVELDDLHQAVSVSLIATGDFQKQNYRESRYFKVRLSAKQNGQVAAHSFSTLQESKTYFSTHSNQP